MRVREGDGQRGAAPFPARARRARRGAAGRCRRALELPRVVGRFGEARVARRMAGDPRGRRAARAADAARERAPRERRRLSRDAARERDRSDRDRPACGAARVGAAGRSHSGVCRRRRVGAGRRRAARSRMARCARRHARARRMRGARRQDRPYSRAGRCGSRCAGKRCRARGTDRREPRAAVARSGRACRRCGCPRRVVRRAPVRPHPCRRAVLGVRHRAPASRHSLAAPRGRHPGARRGTAPHPVGVVAACEAGRRTALRDLFGLPRRRRMAGPLV